MSALTHCRVVAMRAATRLVMVLVLGACGAEPVAEPPADAGAVDADAARRLRLVEGGPSALVLGVWADPAGRAWFAGGEPGPWGRLLAYTDGDVVRRAEAPPGPGLWWVFGVDAERVWACGEEGRVLAGRGGRFVEEATGLGDDAVLWGLWGSGADDLWAVGGGRAADAPRGLLLRSSGDGRWSRVEDPSLPTDANLFKVWGSAADDVHIVGERGVALHWDGRALRRVDVPAPDLLFTVHGRRGGPVLAVGGAASGVAYAWREGAWRAEILPERTPGLNGVFVREDGTAVVSGASGALLRRDARGTWSTLDPDRLAGRDTLHAVFDEGTLWAVGGDLLRLDHGLILTDRDPTPTLEIGAAQPPPDAGTSDASTPPSDAGPPPDFGADATRDAGLDAAPDAAPDAQPPDEGLPDATVDATPDATPLPGAGERCDGPCAGDLECLEIFFQSTERPLVCTEPCRGPEECEAYGPGACCMVPGPQTMERACVPAEVADLGCP